jgi:hypothetical protein
MDRQTWEIYFNVLGETIDCAIWSATNDCEKLGIDEMIKPIRRQHPLPLLSEPAASSDSGCEVSEETFVRSVGRARVWPQERRVHTSMGDCESTFLVSKCATLTTSLFPQTRKNYWKPAIEGASPGIWFALNNRWKANAQWLAVADWWRWFMHDQEIQQRFHLMQKEIEATGSLMREGEDRSYCRYRLAKNWIGSLENIYGALPSRICRSYPKFREEAIQSINPEWIGSEPAKKIGLW